MNFRETAWQEAVKFHGHACPGLAIGVRLALDFLDDLSLSRAGDEELAVVAETDACGVDGLQSVLGVTPGKGNLWVFRRGKHAFTVFSKSEPEGRRYSWRALDLPEQGQSEKIEYYLTGPRKDLYIHGPARVSRPPEAARWTSRQCQLCGEVTAEPYMRVRNGHILCLDCADVPLDFSSPALPISPPRLRI
jgi:formylmethanofuran dehydrogenase subunit E